MSGNCLASAGEVFARSVGRSVGIHARIIAATRAGTWTTPRFRAGVHHAILICHPDKRAAQGRRDVSDAGRPIISGGPRASSFPYFPRVKRWIVFHLPLKAAGEGHSPTEPGRP